MSTEQAMGVIPVLGIPFYNRADLLARCVESIDYPVELLVIVQQGPELLYLGGGRRLTRIHQEMTASGPQERSEVLGLIPECVKQIVSIIHPNAGVAGAWNEIIKLFPVARPPRAMGGVLPGGLEEVGGYWMIANNDIQFAPGDLQRMHAEANRPHGAHGTDAAPVGMLYGNHGASWFAITVRGVELAGLFDENIYPAYLEDCDMSRRMDLLGVQRVNVQGCQAVHGVPEQRGSCTINAAPEIAKRNALTHSGNFQYYRAKWGGINGEEKFSNPFNDPHWPIDFWRWEPARRASQVRLWSGT